MLDPPFLEVDRPPSPLVLDDHVRLDLVVGHREEAHAGTPAVAQRLGDRGEGIARGDHLGTYDMRGGVPIAQTEPGGFHPVGGELLLDREGLVGPAPALLLVDPTPQGVHHGVQVGADPETEEGDVVTGVADDGDLVVCGLVGAGRRVRSERGLEAAEETRAADTAGRYDYPHAPKSGRLVSCMGRLPRGGRDPSCPIRYRRSVNLRASAAIPPHRLRVRCPQCPPVPGRADSPDSPTICQASSDATAKQQRGTSLEQRNTGTPTPPRGLGPAGSGGRHDALGPHQAHHRGERVQRKFRPVHELGRRLLLWSHGHAASGSRGGPGLHQ